MAYEPNPYKLYKFNVNAQENIEALPYMGNVPQGHTEIDFGGALQSLLSTSQNEYTRLQGLVDTRSATSAAIAALPEYKQKVGSLSNLLSSYKAGKFGASDFSILQSLAPTFKQFKPNDWQTLVSGGQVGSPYTMVNGVPWDINILKADEQLKADVAAGKMVQAGAQPGLYVSPSSPGISNLLGIQQGTQGFAESLNQVYLKRPDLQAVYRPSGEAINPNDPRVAGIPTLMDWARQFGVKEEQTLRASIGQRKQQIQQQVISQPQQEFAESLIQVWLKRPDLQELYNPDGSAKNLNDPRIAGIPTLMDWAKRFGVNEEQTLGASFQQFQKQQKTEQATQQAVQQTAQAQAAIPPPPRDEIKKAFEEKKISGEEAPKEPGKAASAVQAAIQRMTPAKGPDFTGIEQQLAADKGYQQLLADRAEYQNVANQRKSLADEYKVLTKEAGLDQLNLEIVNMKKILDGTTDDIRAEIVKSGVGMATESQILALANSRNRVLLRNYQALLDTKQSITDQINTMVGLVSQDRNFALQAINQKFQFDQEINSYRDKFVNNATEAYQNIVNTVGWKGLLSMTNGDSYSISLVEKTLGLQPGGLQGLASYIPPLTEGQKLDLELKRSQIAENQAQAVKTLNEATTGNLKDYPASYQEYLLVQKEGFTGTYNDYQTMDANRKRAITNISNITGLSPYQTIQTVNAIQDNARQDPDVNQFTAVRGAYEQARQAVAQSNSAGDIVLMRTIAKITDPTSAVREEEFRTFQNAVGTLPRYGVQVTKQMIGAGQLTDAGRKALFGQVENIYNQRKAAYNSKINFYQDQAKAVGGTIPSYVAPETPVNTQTPQLQTNQQGFWSKVGNWLWGE